MNTNKNEATAPLSDVWNTLFPFLLAEKQLAVWLILHNAEIVRQGIIAAGRKAISLNGNMNQEYAVRFASSVMNRLSRETQEAS